MEPYDDKNIRNFDFLIRRINPNYHVVHDKNIGCKRISTKAFSPSSNGGMSVDILALMEKAGIDAKKYVTTPIFTGSVKFQAGCARNVGLLVGRNPIEEGENANPYHGDVWRKNKSYRFTKSQLKSLQKASKWFVEIPGVKIHK